MKYTINTWIKVLETLRYKIDDEMSKAGGLKAQNFQNNNNLN